MTTVGTAAAWYPDPADATLMRWWDGRQWTANVRPSTGATVAANASGFPVDGGLKVHQNASSKRANHYSLLTLGVAALYVVIALVANFVLIGFIPLALALRAKNAREPLAPLALIVAAGILLFSFKIVFGI
jgi:hypothetical protein